MHWIRLINVQSVSSELQSCLKLPVHTCGELKIPYSKLIPFDRLWFMNRNKTQTYTISCCIGCNVWFFFRLGFEKYQNRFHKEHAWFYQLICWFKWTTPLHAISHILQRFTCGIYLSWKYHSCLMLFSIWMNNLGFRWGQSFLVKGFPSLFVHRFVPEFQWTINGRSICNSIIGNWISIQCKFNATYQSNTYSVVSLRRNATTIHSKQNP